MGLILTLAVIAAFIAGAIAAFLFFRSAVGTPPW
jgi:hypothetical protein